MTLDEEPFAPPGVISEFGRATLFKSLSSYDEFVPSNKLNRFKPNHISVRI
jgi:hypothetical protein